jgi:hypothetical protein
VELAGGEHFAAPARSNVAAVAQAQFIAGRNVDQPHAIGRHGLQPRLLTRHAGVGKPGNGHARAAWTALHGVERFIRFPLPAQLDGLAEFLAMHELPLDQNFKLKR